MTPPEMSVAPGYRRPADPRIWGAGIGAIGASVFVLSYRDLLGSPWSTVALAAYVVAAAAFVWAVLFVERRFEALARPRANPWLVYLGAVLFEVALIAVGTMLLERVGRLDLRPVLIVLAVGLHFIPFAWVFRLPLFLPLASIMSVLDVLGLLLGAFVHPVFSPAVAVLTGL
ncbi:MAG: hypothetical protein Q4F65_12760, partial [Propionibacteriaceae bacterium]|nr:hypothetical protein [Propionibacteriaceae bacterium]